jgi:molybdate transport system permease protein
VILEPVLLSLRVSLLATLLVMPIAVAVAWMLSRSRVPFKSVLTALINLPLVLPPVVTGFFLLDVFGRNGWLHMDIAFTWWAAVLAAMTVSLPLGVWTVKVAMEAVPVSLENAARVLGRDEWRVFWEVTLPLCRRGLGGGAVLVFARSLGEFGATIVVAGMTAGETLTMPSAVYLYMQQVGMDDTVRALIWIAVAISFAALLVVNALVWAPHKNGV